MQVLQPKILATILVGLSCGLAAEQLAVAQQADSTRYAEEPTGGLEIPTAGLAGEHDAFSAVKNPAGLAFTGGFHAGLGLTLDDADEATASGSGLGLYLSQVTGGELLPRMGLGVGLELLSPSRKTLDPDPGSPTRLTLAGSLALGESAALGVAWHRFFDDPNTPTRGLATFDLGWSARFGSRLAFGVVVRDVNAPNLMGTEVQRRYELEIASRPLATDRLEAAIGGRIGESEADVDGWLRLSARLYRGVYLKGEVATRELRVIDNMAAEPRDEREYLASCGLEISFGSVGATFVATGARADSGDRRLASGAMYLRVSSEQVPSVQGPRRRIERIQIKGGIGESGLTGALFRLRSIARDPAVVAVILQIDDIGAGWASVQELRKEVLRVRKAGKKVFALLVAATTRDYFLASAADKIYVDPAGGIRLSGFAGTSVYLKSAFEKLGVSAQIEKIEEYKSAPEQWTRTGPSEPARHMRNELYDSIYAELVSAIASGRKIAVQTAKGLIDAGPYAAGDLGELEPPDKTPGRDKAAPGGDTRPRTFGGALAAKSPLVDAIANSDEIIELVKKELGTLYPLGQAARQRPERWSLPRIAIIYLNGDIVSGKSRTIPILGRRLVGGDTIAQAIAQARSDSRVEAIILRIDSGGGSALASEIMAREVFKTRGVKPIICSMGDVAASGGYFAAAGCDTIFAEATTITGSIGIFTGKFEMSNLLSRLGVSWHVYKRGVRSDMESTYRPYTEDERKFIKKRSRYFYNRFLDAVAAGRGLTREQVDAIGRGRVWSGAQAKEIKLVDEIGGLSQALTLAKRRVGLGENDYARIVILPQTQTSLLGRLTGLPGVGAAAAESGQSEAESLFLQALPGLRQLFDAIPASLWAEPNAVQARLPFHIQWH